MNKITSNAYNFAENFNSGVDPRTGMFQVNINMGVFNSNDGVGNKIPLAIHYSSSNNEDCGVGRGWSFVFSRYDKRKEWLSLSSGQSFKIEWDSENQEFYVPYRKLKDIRICIDTQTQHLIVYFKDGTEEHISIEEGTVYKVVSAQGLETFYLFKNMNNRKYLTEINDNTGRKVLINWYDNKYKTTITHFFNNEILQTFILDKVGRDFTLGRFCVEGQASHTYFEYKKMMPSNYMLVSKITHATGLIEEIIYSNRHSTPTNTPIKKIPAVYQHILFPGEHQERKITKYTFTDRNYLGFGSDRKWTLGEDTLFKANSNYRYLSEETINNNKKIKRTYNKYHLIVREEYISSGSLIKQIDYMYYCDEYKSIENQPAQYSLIREQKTVHYNDTRESSTLIAKFEYDSYANLIKCINSDQTQIIKSYYPIEGETEAGEQLCPPQNNKFISLLKSEKFIANDDNHSERITRNTYQEITSLFDSNKKIILILSQSNHVEKNVFSYYTDKNDHFTYGRLKKAISYINNTLSNTIDYSYEIKDNEIENTMLTSFENVLHQNTNKITLKFIEHYCRKKLHLIRLRDPENNLILYEYDFIGRLTSTKRHPDTLSKQIIRVEYNDDPNNIYVKSTNEYGHITKLKLNSAGNTIMEYIQSSSVDSIHLSKEYQYDALGLLIKKIEHDLCDTDKIRLETIFSYDDNQLIKEVQHPDKRIERYSTDAIKNKLTYIQDELIKEEAYFNDSGLILEKKTYSFNNKNVSQPWNLIASSKYEYDGFGNIVKSIDTSGHIVSFLHDDLDRIISTTRNIDGQDIIEEFVYPSHSIEAIPSEIYINQKLIGKRVFDSIMRITEEIQSGFSTYYTYDGISNRELTIIQPRSETDKDIVTFTYDNILKQPNTKKTLPSQNIDTEYVYYPGGRLMQSSNPTCKSIYIFDDVNYFGQLVEQRSTIDGLPEEIIKTSYSKMGNIITQSNGKGNYKYLTYDSFNRLITIREKCNNRIMLSTIEYDKFSRAIKYVTNEMQPIPNQYDKQLNSTSIELVLNALGAELSRIVKINNSIVYTIKQSFNSEQQLINKIYISNNSKTTEKYTYDSLHRLTKYTCTGPHYAEDESGRKIKKQVFTHDPYGNVTKIISTFNDNSVNITSFTFTHENPCLLGRVINSNSSIFNDFECRYDGMGNLSNDEKGNIYAHNVLGQLDTVYTKSNTLLTSYEYFPDGNLASQKYSDNSRSFCHYINNILVKESCNESNLESLYHFNTTGLSARVFNENTQSKTEFLLGDNQGSILKTKNLTDNTETNKTYSCFGESKK